jgi:hypothetical protein
MHIVDGKQVDAARALCAFWNICDATSDPWGNLCDHHIVFHLDKNFEQQDVREIALRVAKVVDPSARVLFGSDMSKDDVVKHLRRFLARAPDPQGWCEREAPEEDWDHEHVEIVDRFNVCPRSTEQLSREGATMPFAQICSDPTCAPCARALRLLAKATDGCLVDDEHFAEEQEEEAEEEHGKERGGEANKENPSLEKPKRRRFVTVLKPEK